MLALTAAAMTLGFASCSDNNDPTPDDSSAKDAKFEAIAKQYLANTVNITYQNLADKTELLVDQLKALRADKTDANVRTACKTFLEALNTDLVCDAINTAMRELFLQIVYGRSQSAFSEDGLVVGAGLEDLGKGLRSQVGTMYGTLAKGPRYLEMTDGYVTGIALNADDEIIGYQFVNFGKMMDFIKGGDDANTAFEKAKGQYGRVADAVRIIDPRKQ